MGQQQILLIVLSVILVGVSISVGLVMFKSHALTANQDALTLDILAIANLAYQYRLRPSLLQGGNGSYIGFDEQFRNNYSEFQSNKNGTYEVEVIDKNHIRIIASSSLYEGSIEGVYNQNVQLVNKSTESDESATGEQPVNPQGKLIKKGWYK